MGTGVSNPGNVLLQVCRLSICYQAGDKVLRALEGVDLTIRAGEIVGLLGESGSGKSTLASAIVRLLPPNASHRGGQVLFQGRDLLKLSERNLRTVRGGQLSLIWQDPALTLNAVMTAGDQIAEVLRAHGGLTRTERRARVLELLSEVGFTAPSEIYGAYPHQLSGGQRQRVVIAQAIACRPALVIADEATSKLDAALEKDILELLRGLCHRYGTALLVISHDPDVLADLADRIAVMYAGQVVEEAEASTIFNHPKHPYTQALLRLAGTSKVTRTWRLPAIEGEGPDLSESHKGCCFEPRCGARVPLCATAEPVEIRSGGGRVSCFHYGESS